MRGHLCFTITVPHAIQRSQVVHRLHTLERERTSSLSSTIKTSMTTTSWPLCRAICQIRVAGEGEAPEATVSHRSAHGLPIQRQIREIALGSEKRDRAVPVMHLGSIEAFEDPGPSLAGRRSTMKEGEVAPPVGRAIELNVRRPSPQRLRSKARTLFERFATLSPEATRRTRDLGAQVQW